MTKIFTFFSRHLKAVGENSLVKLMTVKTRSNIFQEKLLSKRNSIEICFKYVCRSHDKTLVATGGTIWGKKWWIFVLVSPIKSQFLNEWWVCVSTQLATVANLSHLLLRFICCRLAEWCMSTFETLNQRGVVIICVIIHCSNGLRKPLVLKVWREISGRQTSALSARLIENQCRVGVTIHEVSTCLAQLFPA